MASADGHMPGSDPKSSQPWAILNQEIRCQGSTARPVDGAQKLETEGVSIHPHNGIPGMSRLGRSYLSQADGHQVWASGYLH